MYNVKTRNLQNKQFQVSSFKEFQVQLAEIGGIKSRDIYLRHVHKFLQNIMKEHRHPVYQLHTPKNSEILEKTFDEPYFELFLWSIFTGKLTLVEFFWKKIQSPLVGAVVGAAVYSKLEHFYRNQKQVQGTTLNNMSKTFQQRANMVFFSLSIQIQASEFSILLQEYNAISFVRIKG